MNEYKVTILGAGLAGCEAALWLAGKDTARFGLELSYDSILRGTSFPCPPKIKMATPKKAKAPHNQ